MWSKITTTEREYFKYFSIRQTIRDVIGLIVFGVAVYFIVKYVKVVEGIFDLNSYFDKAELCLDALCIGIVAWILNVCTSTVLGLKVRIALLIGKCCYGSMYGKRVYAAEDNRLFYNLQRYSVKCDLSEKILKKKKIYFVNTKCAKESIRVIVIKPILGFVYYGVCI